MREPLIGILGGYGGVGRVVATCVDAWGLGRLRIGGRNRTLAEQLSAETFGGAAEAAAVDATDPEALSRFCAGCDVIVNCVGPLLDMPDRVARASLDARAHYVDPGGDLRLDELLSRSDWTTAGRAAILSAGMMPGLSGILPQWLARQGFQRPVALTAYVGLKDRFTPAAAREYVASLDNGYGESLGAWRHCRRVPRALRPITNTLLPWFRGRVSVYPYLSAEAERLATSLGLVDLSWYNAFEGDHVLAAIGRLNLMDREQRASAATLLIDAAALDLFGESPRQTFVFKLEGHGPDGAAMSRLLLCHADDTYTASGTVAAIAVADLLRGHVPAGVRFAMDALDSVDLVERLRQHRVFSLFQILDGGGDSTATSDEVDNGML